MSSVNGLYMCAILNFATMGKKTSQNIMDSMGIIMEAGGSTFFSSKLHKFNKNIYILDFLQFIFTSVNGIIITPIWY